MYWWWRSGCVDCRARLINVYNLCELRGKRKNNHRELKAHKGLKSLNDMIKNKEKLPRYGISIHNKVQKKIIFFSVSFVNSVVKEKGKMNDY